MGVVKVIYMFNLTNIGLHMCVKEYSDLFLNLMIEHEPILAIMFVQENYLAWREKVCDSTRMAGKSLRKYPHDGIKLAEYIC